MQVPTRTLVVSQAGMPAKEFELTKGSVTLGRAIPNDIDLVDARVAPYHARLDLSASGATIVDLGSSAGTLVNGNPVTQAELRPGDVIMLGDTQIVYEPERAPRQTRPKVIDSEEDLDQTIGASVVRSSIRETSAARLIAFNGHKTWRIPLEDADSVSIGRGDANELVFDQPNVARRHAEVVRKANAFVLRDLDSSTGTWRGGERVSELNLRHGDSFQIDDVQLVYKGTQRDEDLDTAAETAIRSKGRRPVVFVPGLMGSELWQGNERVWPNVKVLFKNPEVFCYPSAVPLEPRGIVQEMVIVPNLIKLDQYNRLGDYLIQSLGYERGVDFFEFAYDWRQDVRISARQLAQTIENLPTSQPIILMGHSLGTLVSRYYVERLGGKQRVERLILMGGPHTGAVKGLTSLLIAPEVLPFGLLGERLREVVASFATSYQIIPTYATGVDQYGNPINFLEDETWVTEEQLPRLRAAREFRRELGLQHSVPTVSIFGYGIKTIACITVQRDADGRMTDIKYKTEEEGDSSVPEQSAVLTGTEIHPVQQYHGALFVDKDVQMRLKLELTRAM